MGIVSFIIVLIVIDKALKMNGRTSQRNAIEDSYNGNSTVIEVTMETFEAEVLNSDKKILIDFYATWCGPCKKLSPIIEEVANEMDSIKFVKIDVDAEEKLASQYGIHSIPTLVMIENGKEVTRSIGLISKDEVKEIINKNS